MPGMLNLTDVLQWVIDGFKHGSFAQQHLVEQLEQAIFHVLAGFRHQLQSPLAEFFKPS